MFGMAQPSVHDLQAVVDFVRHRGSAHYPLESIPGEFKEWRSRLRRLARASNVRISIRRTSEYVLIDNPEYEPSSDEFYAVADVLQAVSDGVQLSYEDAVHARARQRIRLFTDPADAGNPS